MTKPSYQLSSKHQKTVYLAFGLLFASGFAYLMVHLFFRPDGEFPQPHIAERPLLTLHGGLAMAFLFVWGTLWPIHMRRAWAQKKHRLSGAILNGALLFQALTSFGLYYLSSEDWLQWFRYAHRVMGITLPIIFGFHLMKARRSQRRRQKT